MLLLHNILPALSGPTLTPTRESTRASAGSRPAECSSDSTKARARTPRWREEVLHQDQVRRFGAVTGHEDEVLPIGADVVGRVPAAGDVVAGEQASPFGHGESGAGSGPGRRSAYLRCGRTAPARRGGSGARCRRPPRPASGRLLRGMAGRRSRRARFRWRHTPASDRPATPRTVAVMVHCPTKRSSNGAAGSAGATCAATCATRHRPMAAISPEHRRIGSLELGARLGRLKRDASLNL
jgi:hypothetical protein